MIRIKRVYDPARSADGFRILVDRLWPRGVSKAAARIDLWSREIAPSGTLRKWFGHSPGKWMSFQKKYRKELRAKMDLLRSIKDLEKENAVVTLVYAAADEHRNNAVVLCSFLRRVRASRKLATTSR